MPEWIAVIIAGMVGGVGHSLVFYGEITMPSWREDNDNRQHWIPGIIGTLFIGGIASLAFWGLYNDVATWSNTAEVRPVIGGLLIGVAGDRALKAFANQFMLESDVKELQDSIHDLTKSLDSVLAKNPPEGEVQPDEQDNEPH